MPRRSNVNVVQILNDVAPEHCFWINNGPILKNLQELPESLEKIDDITFKHHVNQNKNDFANWIEDVIGDKALASALRRIKTRKTTVKKIKSRLILLKKLAKKMR